MKKYSYILAAVLLGFSFTSCQENLGSEPGNDKLPAVVVYKYAPSSEYDSDTDQRVRFVSNDKVTKATYLVEKVADKEAFIASQGESAYAEKVLSSGEDFYVVDLDIGRDTVKVDSMICFDREFPESARILMLKGAEVILAPNACPMEINRLSALRTRAYENMLAITTCNYPKGQPDCNGHSTVFDGVAWLEDEPGVRDMCIFEAPEEEGVYLTEIDLDMLRNYREHEVMGNKCRHPEKYGILTVHSQAREMR